MLMTFHTATSIPSEKYLVQRIVLVRDTRVMLDSDLASLYGVTTGAFNQAVKRNIERFPQDFRFELTREEAKLVLAQLSPGSRRNFRRQPAVFTEQGVAMLSGVLQSPTAIQVNVAIIRAFIHLRQIAENMTGLVGRVTVLERRAEDMEHDFGGKFDRVFSVLRELTGLPPGEIAGKNE